eukprot:gene5401-6737_t
MSNTMKAAVFPAAGKPLEIKDLPIPNPSKGQVRIKVKACGVCHTDLGVGGGHFGNSFPIIPGHEVAGIVDSVGDGVSIFKKGDRVGVGYFGGGHCGGCKSCVVDNCWIACPGLQTTGVTYNGGYAEYIVVPQDAIARIPDDMSFVDAAPLLCAGITTFNSLRNMGLKPGKDIVAVQGIGGLGHLAIQYARKSGFITVALSTSNDKKDLAMKLGANHYFNVKEGGLEQLAKLGGAKCVLCTAPDQKSIEQLVPSMAFGGKIVLLAAVPSITVSPIALLSKGLSVIGWYSGDSRDSQDTLTFSHLQGIKPMVTTYPLEKAQECLDNISKARFRSVLLIDSNQN